MTLSPGPDAEPGRGQGRGPRQDSSCGRHVGLREPDTLGSRPGETIDETRSNAWSPWEPKKDASCSHLVAKVAKARSNNSWARLSPPRPALAARGLATSPEAPP